MGRLRKLLCLPSADRHLLIKAVLLVGVVRVGLWLLPFRTWRRILTGRAQTNCQLQLEDANFIARVVWAVRTASRYVPAATCLTQALATQALLCRRGHPTSLHIGVARSKAGEFQAHAWVEYQGKVVIGGRGALSHFTPLLSLGEERP
jgi:hypothetical protein